jgi:hypothetical protein
MENKPNKDGIIAIVVCVLAALLFFSTCSDSGSSRSKKSYAEQYGYSVEDFYYKGANGKWYKK